MRYDAAAVRRPSLACLACLACLLAPGCDRPPAADSLATWTPADHHSADDDRPAPSASAKPRGAPRGADDAAQLVELAWRQQCSSCHGASGHGDGPMGPMVQAPDLSNDSWQSRTSDADIAAVIRSGRGKMPRFDLPGPVVDGLVARIRALRPH
jgi:cytochrome c oxidase cbb3-type subunit 3